MGIQEPSSGSPMGSSYKTTRNDAQSSSVRTRGERGQWARDRGALEAWGLLVGRVHRCVMSLRSMRLRLCAAE